MIITGRVRSKWLPGWYAERVASRARRVAEQNPGFHRVVLECRPARAYDLGLMVNPDIEPDMRRILSRVMRLDPQEPDPDPWARA